jgi:hypothetical protein
MPRARRPLQLVIIGAVAAGLALGSQLAGLAPLDAPVYAGWRHPAAPSGGVLLVRGDAASSAAGDHAALARLIGRLSRAGAAAIVIDLPPTASRSGATGEALLRQTVAQAGNVAIAWSPDTDVARAFAARTVGHTTGGGAEGLAAIPMFVTDGARRIPALGLAAAAVALNAEPTVERSVVTLGRGPRVRLDAGGRALVSPSGQLPTIAFAELARETGLPTLATGKVVFLLGDSARAAGIGLHAELASAILTGWTLAPVPALPVWTVTLALAIAAAWSWLALRWW